MNPVYRRRIFHSNKNGKFYIDLIARRGGKIVMDAGEGYNRKQDAIRQFDKIFSVYDLQLLHNNMVLALSAPRKVNKNDHINRCIATLEKIRGLIDRSTGKS